MYAWFLFLRPGRCYLRIFTPRKRSLRETFVHELLEGRARAYGIGNRYAQPRALGSEQFVGIACAEPGGIQTDAGAPDRGIGAAAEPQIQVDGVEDVRQRVAWMSQHFLAIDVVAHDDHVRLAAMQQA